MRALIVAMLLIVAGCQQTTTTEPAGELGEAWACVHVGSAYVDPIISDLIELGYDMQYESPYWYKDGMNIGYAAYEDEAFNACGPRNVIEPMLGEP